MRSRVVQVPTGTNETDWSRADCTAHSYIYTHFYKKKPFSYLTNPTPEIFLPHPITPLLFPQQLRSTPTLVAISTFLKLWSSPHSQTQKEQSFQTTIKKISFDQSRTQAKKMGCSCSKG